MKRFSMTSLLPVEERLRAAVHWEESLRATGGPDFAYRLNAYLSAARSVTFLPQKKLAHLPVIVPWWEGRQAAIRTIAQCGSSTTSGTSPRRWVRSASPAAGDMGPTAGRGSTPSSETTRPSPLIFDFAGSPIAWSSSRLVRSLSGDRRQTGSHSASLPRQTHAHPPNTGDQPDFGEPKPSVPLQPWHHAYNF